MQNGMARLGMAGRVAEWRTILLFLCFVDAAFCALQMYGVPQREE
jgi:hypothetical protein